MDYLPESRSDKKHNKVKISKRLSDTQLCSLQVCLTLTALISLVSQIFFSAVGGEHKRSQKSVDIGIHQVVEKKI